MKYTALVGTVYVLLCACALVTPRILDTRHHFRAMDGDRNDLTDGMTEDQEVLLSGIVHHCLQASWNDDLGEYDESGKQFVYKRYVFSPGQMNDVCRTLAKYIAKHDLRER